MSISKSRLFCEKIADAVCPAWRKDLAAGTAEVFDSIPNSSWNPNALLWEKATESVSNFHSWELQRSIGLVRVLRVSWGKTAAREYDRTFPMMYGGWSYSADMLPIFIQVGFDPAKAAVAGKMDKVNTTANRIHNDIYDISRGSLAPPCTEDVTPYHTQRINVTEWKQKK